MYMHVKKPVLDYTTGVVYSEIPSQPVPKGLLHQRAKPQTDPRSGESSKS